MARARHGPCPAASSRRACGYPHLLSSFLRRGSAKGGAKSCSQASFNFVFCSAKVPYYCICEWFSSESAGVDWMVWSFSPLSCAHSSLSVSGAGPMGGAWLCIYPPARTRAYYFKLSGRASRDLRMLGVWASSLFMFGASFIACNNGEDRGNVCIQSVWLHSYTQFGVQASLSMCSCCHGAASLDVWVPACLYSACRGT